MTDTATNSKSITPAALASAMSEYRAARGFANTEIAKIEREAEEKVAEIENGLKGPRQEVIDEFKPLAETTGKLLHELTRHHWNYSNAGFSCVAAVGDRRYSERDERDVSSSLFAADMQYRKEDDEYENPIYGGNPDKVASYRFTVDVAEPDFLDKLVNAVAKKRWLAGLNEQADEIIAHEKRQGKSVDEAMKIANAWKAEQEKQAGDSKVLEELKRNVGAELLAPISLGK